MGKVPGRWLSVMLLLIALAIGLFWLAKPLSDRGLDWLAKLSEIASFIVAFVGLLLPGADKIAKWLRPPMPLSQQEIDSDLAKLRRALRERWRQDKPSPDSRVYEASPMRVRFEIAHAAEDMPGSAASNDAAAIALGGGDFDSVLQVFAQYPRHRCVILGEAGAGKTALATELVRELLLDSGRSLDLFPIALPAVAWNPRRESLSHWLAQQLAMNYGWLPIKHAHALVKDGRLLPVLDGLDEMPGELQSAAIAGINGYGWDRPLVVTSRKEEYGTAVHHYGDKGVSRAVVVELRPLLLSDIKGYLDPDAGGRWALVFSKLDSEPDGHLAEVLANPLMLWLASVVYARKNPDEMADDDLFGSRPAIENYLLAEFVPTAYADDIRQRAARQFECTVEQAQRWLGFLAGGDGIRYKAMNDIIDGFPPVLRKHRSADEFPAEDTLAWWQFRKAVHGWRLPGMGLRATLLCSLTAGLLALVLARHGNWRRASYLDNLFLGGPVGRLIRPTVDKLGMAVAPRSAQNLPQLVLLQLHPVGVGNVLQIIGPSAGLIAFVAYLPSEGRFRMPKRLQIRPLPLLGKTLIRMTWCGALCIFTATFICSAALAVYRASHPSYRIADISAVISSRSTLMSLLAVSLLGLTWIPSAFTARSDISGAIGPSELLRLDRQADLVVTLSHRSALALAIWLYCGTQLAVAYSTFAASATLIGLTFGGQRAFASRTYTDARIWLACRGRVPWRTMQFLDDAGRRGVLRQVGAVYQFRHLLMQEQLEHSWRYCTDPYIRSQERWRKWKGHGQATADLVREHTGRQQETLAGMRKAVNDYLRLSPADRQKVPTGLAGTLDTLDRRLTWSTGTEQALGGLRDVAAAYRSLANADPAEFRPYLAGSLHCLALRLGSTWREQEQLHVIKEAVDTERRLAQTDPAEYLPQLARSLDYLAHLLRNNGEEQEACAATSEAREIRRRLGSKLAT